MSNGAQQASGGATYRMLRELGLRTQRSYAALREPGDLVVAQRFVRVNAAGGSVTGATALDAEATALLLRDARSLAKNWHLNVARVRHVDLCAAPHRELTIATELIDGATLDDLFAAAQRLRSSARDPLLPFPVLVRIILDVLAGLHALHGLRDGMNVLVGAIHGELCPANVVVGKDGVARIVNVLRKRPVRVKHGSEAMGYAAPEAFEGEGTDDPRADVYAVGVMLWEGLAGRRLYQERDPARILSRQREGEVTPPAIHPSSPFARLVEIAMRALSFDPSLRFRGAGEMAAELRKIAATRLAAGTAVAALVSDLCGDRIRMRRAELDPTTSGTRRRAQGEIETLDDLGHLAETLEAPHIAPTIPRLAETKEMPVALIAAARPSTPRGIEALLLRDDDEQLLDDDDLPGPRGSSPELDLETAIALATPHFPAPRFPGPLPAPAPLPRPRGAGPDTTKQLISTALSLTTSKMRAVAVERSASPPAPPVAPNPTPGDFVIPIDVSDTASHAARPRAPRIARGLVLYAFAATLVLGVMGAFVALSPELARRAVTSPTLAAPPPAPLNDGALPTEPTAIATTPTARNKVKGASSAAPTTSGSARTKPGAAPAPVPVPAASGKPKKSIYEPDGL